MGAHAWGNATFDDLLGALERASGRDLRRISELWEYVSRAYIAQVAAGLR